MRGCFAFVWAAVGSSPRPMTVASKLGPVAVLVLVGVGVALVVVALSLPAGSTWAGR